MDGHFFGTAPSAGPLGHARGMLSGAELQGVTHGAVQQFGSTLGCAVGIITGI